jgi:hypothetical protein
MFNVIYMFDEKEFKGKSGFQRTVLKKAQIVERPVYEIKINSPKI